EDTTSPSTRHPKRICDRTSNRHRQLLRTRSLLQTALAKSWSAWKRIQGDPEPYVRQVLANTYNSWWRRRWNGERPTDALPDRAAASPQAAVDERDEVWRALGRLPKQQKLVLVLRYFEDLSEAEIAQTLGISPGSVKTHASKGLAKLRLDPSLLPMLDDDAPAGNERLVAVRERVARRRRANVTRVVAACLAAVALIAAYALLPQLRTKALPEPAFRIEMPRYAQNRSGFVDIDYYRLTTQAQHNYAARLDPALTWTPTGQQEALFIACQHRGTSALAVTVRVNGHDAGVRPCVSDSLLAWETFRTMLDPQTFGLVAGRPAVVSLELAPGASGPLLEGTVAVAVGELVPFSQIPLPPRPTEPAPLDRALDGVDPATVTLLEAGGAHTTTLTWRGQLTVLAQTQSSGRLQISVDGIPVSTLDFGTFPVEGKHQVGTTLTAGRTYLNGYRFDPRQDAKITIAIEAERLTGDWFVAIHP
ncbi:SigE family RNA polymerase sigma factor, partial [Catellatospora sp. NPDC049609]|uniref:SigE family RNA polymerase sigma factor n=1 Tax=Catellatospora sp. NPDC049609 TaxID=3155505 RepID=UPI00342AE05F